MGVSQKCQYALRAVFELARRHQAKPTSISEIAGVQAIPPRFLELILGQLRKAGIVTSRRGVHGGYVLNRAPESLSVGEIVRLIDGSLAPVNCIAGSKKAACPLKGDCAFMGMWERARDAVARVYDETTFQDLIDEDQASRSLQAPSYCI